MNHQELLASLQTRGLRAWQANFAASFLQTDSAAFQLLAGPPGAGKMYASVAIAAELSALGAKRILVLAPALLSEAWRERLAIAQGQISVLLVTRQVLREMEAALPIGQSPWSSDGVYVISQDLAKQGDIALGLAAVDWDLVIVDEAHRFAAPLRAALLDRLMAAAVVRRLLLLSATPLPALQQWLHSLPDGPVRFSSPLVVTNWFGVLQNWDGSMLERPRIDWRVVSYKRGSDEIRFVSQFIDLIAEFESGGGSKFLIQILSHRAASSMFAVEQSLQRLRQTLRSTTEEFDPYIERANSLDAEQEWNAEGEVEKSDAEGVPGGTERAAGLKVVERCIEALDTVATDEKLNAFRQLVGSISGTGSGVVPKIGVFSLFVDTVTYLYAALQDIGITLFKVTGAMSFTDRQATVEEFVRQGGLLIGTDAALSEGIELGQMTDAIYYDLPANPMALEQRRGRFDRYGRKTPCTVYLLRDESGVNSLETELMDSFTSIQMTES